MIGQKIREHQGGDDFLDNPPVSPRPQPNHGLSACPRSFRPAGLKIITQSAEPLYNQSCRLNAVESKPYSARLGSHENIFTPMTSNTFGIPHGFLTKPGHSSSLCPSSSRSPVRVAVDPEAQRARRSLRYSCAQQSLTTALVKSLRDSSTPRQLQIRALEQITTFLVSQLREVETRAEALQQKLEHRELEPNEYQQVQEERWMRERRRQVVQEEEKIASEYLRALRKTPVDDFNYLSSDQHSCRTEAESRYQQNLRQFLQRSPTKTSRPLSRRSSGFCVAIDSPSVRRKVSPLQLQPRPLPPPDLHLSREIWRVTSCPQEQNIRPSDASEEVPKLLQAPPSPIPEGNEEDDDFLEFDCVYELHEPPTAESGGFPTFALQQTATYQSDATTFTDTSASMLGSSEDQYSYPLVKPGGTADAVSQQKLPTGSRATFSYSYSQEYDPDYGRACNSPVIPEYAWDLFEALDSIPDDVSLRYSLPSPSSCSPPPLSVFPPSPFARSELGHSRHRSTAFSFSFNRRGRTRSNGTSRFRAQSNADSTAHTSQTPFMVPQSVPVAEAPRRHPQRHKTGIGALIASIVS